MTSTLINVVVQTWESDSPEDVSVTQRMYTLELIQDMVTPDCMVGFDVLSMIEKLLPGEVNR